MILKVAKDANNNKNANHVKLLKEWNIGLTNIKVSVFNVMLIIVLNALNLINVHSAKFTVILY